MPVAKDQIRQIISENNINSVEDVYAKETGIPPKLSKASMVNFRSMSSALKKK